MARTQDLDDIIQQILLWWLYSWMPLFVTPLDLGKHEDRH